MSIARPSGSQTNSASNSKTSSPQRSSRVSARESKRNDDNDIDLSDSLTSIFLDYSTKGQGIDGARFLKFCRDAHLFTDSSFRPEDVDIVFAKFKESGKRFLNFEGFTSALVSIANKKGTSTEDILYKIIQSSPSAQPSSATVIPQPNRFHDDASTYTGVHKAGGPTTIDHHHRDLSQMVDREVKSNMDWQLSKDMKSLNLKNDEGMMHEVTSKARDSSNYSPDRYRESPRTVVQPRSTAQPTSARLGGSGSPSSMTSRTTHHPDGSPRTVAQAIGRGIPAADTSLSYGSGKGFHQNSARSNTSPSRDYQVSSDLKSVFNDYASKTVAIAGGGIDGAKFLKLCRDVYLFDTSFRPQDLDVVFAKYKEPGLRHISYRGFINSIADIASRKNVDFDSLVNHILNIRPSAQPSSATVIPQPNRFHDDASTYTGVHKAGGPSTIDHNHKNLSQMVSRGAT